MEKNRKLRKKLLAVSVLSVLLLTGLTVNAASIGTFTYEMSVAVYGKTKFSLSNKSTTVKTTGTTYSYATDNKTTSQNYKVALHKVNSSGTFKTAGAADGTTKSVSFGTVSSGSYNVDLMVSNPQSSGSVSWYIKGSGSVNQ